jgi:hypothetical protein
MENPHYAFAGGHLYFTMHSARATFLRQLFYRGGTAQETTSQTRTEGKTR